MKQLGLGLIQYVQDNDEMMPNISDKSGKHMAHRDLSLHKSPPSTNAPNATRMTLTRTRSAWMATPKATRPTIQATTAGHSQIRDEAHLPAQVQSPSHSKTFLDPTNSSRWWKPLTILDRSTTLTMPPGSARPAAVCGPVTRARATICSWMDMSNTSATGHRPRLHGKVITKPLVSNRDAAAFGQWCRRVAGRAAAVSAVGGRVFYGTLYEVPAEGSCRLCHSCHCGRSPFPLLCQSTGIKGRPTARPA